MWSPTFCLFICFTGHTWVLETTFLVKLKHCTIPLSHLIRRVFRLTWRVLAVWHLFHNQTGPHLAHKKVSSKVIKWLLISSSPRLPRVGWLILCLLSHKALKEWWLRCTYLLSACASGIGLHATVTSSLWMKSLVIHILFLCVHVCEKD